MLLSKLTWQAYRRFAARPIGELDDFAKLNPDRQRAEMAERLLAQVHYFGKREDALPEWREAAQITNPDELWRNWPSLPVMTKQLLNTKFEPVEMQRRFGLHGRVNSTGGSTGEPTRFFLDDDMLRASRAVHLYSRLKMGWRPGMPTIIVWGAERDIGKQTKLLPRIANRFYGNRIIPGFAVGKAEVREILRIVREDGPVAIYGYSSLLEFVAQTVIAERGEAGAAVGVAVAWNGGEMLFEHQVDLFKRAFGVPILNRYGGRELSVTAFQEREGAAMRLMRPWVFLEIVDSAGRPVAPGETGRMLLTSTICRGTPFLRYEIGDMGRYSAGDCDESGIQSIATIEGRNSGVIRKPDGSAVSSIYWNHLMKEYPEVTGFQVRVQNDGALKLLLTGPGFPEARESHLKAALKHVWQDRRIDLVWTDAIPRSAQGKLIQVVHES